MLEGVDDTPRLIGIELGSTFAAAEIDEVGTDPLQFVFGGAAPFDNGTLAFGRNQNGNFPTSFFYPDVFAVEIIVDRGIFDIAGVPMNTTRVQSRPAAASGFHQPLLETRERPALDPRRQDQSAPQVAQGCRPGRSVAGALRSPGNDGTTAASSGVKPEQPRPPGGRLEPGVNRHELQPAPVQAGQCLVRAELVPDRRSKLAPQHLDTVVLHRPEAVLEGLRLGVHLRLNI